MFTFGCFAGAQGSMPAPSHQRRNGKAVNWMLISVLSLLAGMLGMAGFCLLAWPIVRRELDAINEFSGMIVIGLLFYGVVAGLASAAACFGGLYLATVFRAGRRRPRIQHPRER